MPFFTELNNQSATQSSSPGIRTNNSTRDRRVQVVKILIEDNFQLKLDLSDMAKAVNLSPWRLAHLFKAEVGISPLRYLTLVRLQRARQYLETGFLTVREIAMSVGIPNPSHFTRSFKAAYGSSPVQHRNTHFRITGSTTLSDNLGREPLDGNSKNMGRSQTVNEFSTKGLPDRDAYGG